jgi:hypothetical protein
MQVSVRTSTRTQTDQGLFARTQTVKKWIKMKNKLATRSLAVAGLLTAGLVSSLVVPAAAADVQVSVFSYPGLNGSSNACDNENFNLAEIVEAEVGYTVDTAITNFTDADLRAKLDSSRFFFMTDMETQNPSTSSFLPASAKTDIKDWTNDGGVMVMTGTHSSYDADFLNTIYSWDVSSVSTSLLTPVLANTSGTPFEDFSGNLGTPSATQAMNMGTVANVSVMWGDSDGTAALVAVVQYGRGYVIYMGFDFYNTGLTGSSGSPCRENSNDWVQEIVPASLKYATTLADANAAPAAPAPYSGPLPTNYSDRTPSIGDEVVVSGLRLNLVTSCTIDGVTAVMSNQSADSFTIMIPEGVTSGLKDLVMTGPAGKLTAQGAWTIQESIPEIIIEAAVPSKVNAGSFNGYVAVYAKGHKGKTLTWKIAGKWFKTTITSDYQIFQRGTIAVGLDVFVDLYIDGEKQLTKTITTR